MVDVVRQKIPTGEGIELQAGRALRVLFYPCRAAGTLSGPSVIVGKKGGDEQIVRLDIFAGSSGERDWHYHINPRPRLTDKPFPLESLTGVRVDVPPVEAITQFFSIPDLLRDLLLAAGESQLAGEVDDAEMIMVAGEMEEVYRRESREAA